jgi:WD40 repeat protein
VSESRVNTASIADRVRSLKADGTIVGAAFLGDTPVFVLGEEALLVVGENEELRVPMHGGAILGFASDDTRIVTGGDDGQIMQIGKDGVPEKLAADGKHRWIDHIALGPEGAVAWSAGKFAFVRTGKGDVKQREMPSTPAGLVFLKKGFRLAVARYNGVSLWFPNLPAEPETLGWKGSHHGVSVSPDGRFLVTAMQEPTLHGWRIADRKDMRMSGYSARVRSLSWSKGGEFLATSGSDQLILWPFSGKDGPMGKQPRLLAPAKERVVAVACHPQDGVIACGYADGMILLVRIDDGAEILARRPGGSPVTALCWDRSGAQLAFGTEDGEGGFLRL